MTARSIATVLMLGVAVGLSVINLARATRSDADTPRQEAMGEPTWPEYAGLPQ